MAAGNSSFQDEPHYDSQLRVGDRILLLALGDNPRQSPPGYLCSKGLPAKKGKAALVFSSILEKNVCQVSRYIHVPYSRGGI